MILIIDNVLSVKECNALIDIHKVSSDRWGTHIPGKYAQEKSLFVLKLDDISKEYLEFIEPIKNKLLNVSKVVKPNIAYEWGEIVDWEPNVHMDWHLDKSSPNTVLTSLTYLNDNYRGGETQLIGGINIPPVVGRTIIFDGNIYKHSVNPVIANNRFTLPIWYTIK